MKKISVFSLLLVAITIVSALPEKLQANGDSPIRIYVDRNVISNGNGESWQTAFRYLQDAISHSVGGRGDEIWIAAGTYYPDEGIGLTKGDRMLSFQFPSGVKVYGSFSGSETSLADRNSSNPRTILSGVISQDVNLRTQNVCTITDEASFDGIDITGGNANSGTVYDKVNGAIMPKSTTGSTPTLFLRNCSFYDNRASQANGVTGGVVLTAIDCSFINNSAGWGSGVGGGDPLWTLINCVFAGNSAGHGGVGYWGNRIAVNCLFVGNSASRGAVFGGLGSAQFINCTFAGNSGTPIFGGSYYTLHVYAANSIFWDENIFTTVSNFRPTHFSNIINDSTINPSSHRAPNILRGGLSALALPNTESIAPDNNYGDESLIIDENPAFVNLDDPLGPDGTFGTSDDGLCLDSASPAIDIAVESLLPSDFYDVDRDDNISELLPFDLKRSVRKQGGGLDLGAYEHDVATPTDSDGDGVNDYREGKDGTDATDPNSFNPLSKGLVAYYPLNNSYADESGFGNNLTNPSAGISFAYDRFGKPAGSLNLSGAQDRIISSARTGITANQANCISLWFYVDQVPDWNARYAGTLLTIRDHLRDTFNSGDEHRILVDNYEGNTRLVSHGGYSDFYVQLPLSSLEGQWHQLVVVFAGELNTSSVYLNGARMEPTVIESRFSSTRDMADGFIHLGSNRLSDGSYADGVSGGSISDVRIYKRSLSNIEVKQLFYDESFTKIQRGFVESEPSLMGHFSQADYDANRTNGRADVTTNPAAFNLFTQSQFDSNRINGQQDVISSPMTYGLYTADSIMDLRMGGVMIQKQGTSATILFQPQTTTDLASLPFTNNGTPITHEVPMPGNKGFVRINAQPIATPAPPQ